MGSHVDLFARIRRDARIEEHSIRALARRHGVARATVRQALAQAEPSVRKTPIRVAPRKQRHTARGVVAGIRGDHRTMAQLTERDTLSAMLVA